MLCSPKVMICTVWHSGHSTNKSTADNHYLAPVEFGMGQMEPEVPAGTRKNVTAAQVANCVQQCVCKQEGQQTYWLTSRRAIRDDRQIGYVCAWI